MSLETYHKLIDDICAKLNISHPESMYISADLEVNGINFSMYHCGKLAENYGVIYADFGPLPKDAADVAMLRLLQTNLYLFAVNSPTFACHADNNHVMLAVNVPLATATADGIFAMLQAFSKMALEWRESYFLTAEERMGGVSGGTSGAQPTAAKSSLNRFSAQFSKSAPSAASAAVRK